MKDDGKNRKNASDGKHTSHPSPNSPEPERILPPRGDYQTLLSFQKAEVIYDITFRFARKYLGKGDRTVDQMIQSARSGKQNILEGSKAATTSKETEIKLTNVGRASLEELLADTVITSACATTPFGTKTPKKRSSFGGWAARHRIPLNSTGSFLKLGRRRLLPTLPSA